MSGSRSRLPRRAAASDQDAACPEIARKCEATVGLERPLGKPGGLFSCIAVYFSTGQRGPVYHGWKTATTTPRRATKTDGARYRRFARGAILCDRPVGPSLSKVQSVDQRIRLGMRCRLSPTADVPSHTSGQLCAITSWEQMQQVAPLFEDFVGSREQCSRHFEAERFGGLDVEHGFVFRRSPHREVGWFLAFQDAVDVGGGKPIQGGLINPEGDQSAFGEETAEVWDRMEP